MSKKKKVNPNRRPATQAEVRKVKRLAETNALTTVWAIFFRTMTDKHGWGQVRLRRLWDECQELADQIGRGEVSVPDIVDSLAEENGIILK